MRQLWQNNGVSHTSRADSPSSALRCDVALATAAPNDSLGIEAPEPISGAIARAVRNSVSSRERREPLPNVRSKLRADRARAIAQRDRAIRKAQRLQRLLQGAHAELAVAMARAEAAERATARSAN